MMKKEKIAIGDKIEFTKITENIQKVTCEVVDLKVFKDFKELFTKVPLDLCGYSEEEIPFATHADMGKYYSADQQKKYGVVAIYIQKL